MYSGKKIRNANEDLEELISNLKIGDGSIFDSATNYEITKVPNGFIYRHEYEGIVFVPDSKEKVGAIKNSIAKTEPKGKIEK